MSTTHDLIVDLSNVLRDRSLHPIGLDASLERWTVLADRLSEPPWSISRVLLIADRSLRHHLSRDEWRQLDQLANVRFEPQADEEILRVAFGDGALIASHDNFDDFRRAYPEIQGSTDRFIGWVPDDLDRPVPQWRTMGQHGDRRLSRKEEGEELRRRDLEDDRVRQRALATWFRCTNRSCFTAGLYPDRLPFLPDYDRSSDVFRCTGCKTELEAAGARSDSVVAVVYQRDRELGRIMVETGQPIVVGRNDAKGVVGLVRWTPEQSVKAVSREHVELSCFQRSLWARDLGSSNGTSLVITHRNDHEPVGSRQIRIDARHRLRLPNSIHIEVSARRAPVDGDVAATRGAASEYRPTALE